MSAIDTIERVLAPAADGKHRSIDEIKRTLHREQCDGVDQHLPGSSIKAQIAKLIERAKARPAVGVKGADMIDARRVGLCEGDS